ncbi:MAG: DsbA family protein [Paracoccaceae bacterium]
MKNIAAAIAILIGLSSPLLAFEINTMTPEEREIFRAEVRAYLLESPEVLMEAIAVLEQRQATADTLGDVDLIAHNAAALFTDSNSYQGGNPDGDVVMVEFLDYRCGFCKRAHPEVVELIKSDGNIKYIIKEFPILGEQSVLASRFAISVLQNTDDETYSTVHDTLMDFRGDISTTSLERLANELNLDTAIIMAEMDSDAVSAVISQNRALAQQMQINGTPGFVIGNQMVRGYAPLDTMRQIVADLRLASR